MLSRKQKAPKFGAPRIRICLVSLRRRGLGSVAVIFAGLLALSQSELVFLLLIDELVVIETIADMKYGFAIGLAGVGFSCDSASHAGLEEHDVVSILGYDVDAVFGQ